MLDAARDLVLNGGVRAATIDKVVVASGAPKGSVYHRFATLNDLLAAMWLRAVRRSQDHFLLALTHPDATEAAVAASLSIYDFARANPGDARLLASMRRADLLGSVTDETVQRALTDVNAPLERAFKRMATRLYGRATKANIERTICAMVDLPHGAMRRHLIDGSAPPVGLREQLERAVRAALATSA